MAQILPLSESHAKTQKEKPSKAPHWKSTVMADSHIHWNAGKDRYPQVIAVSFAAPCCATDFSLQLRDK